MANELHNTKSKKSNMDNDWYKISNFGNIQLLNYGSKRLKKYLMYDED